MKKLQNQSGFTLIEILVVIGIIAILATIVIIAINPARQFAQARNTQRWSNVNTLLNAVGQRLADNRGTWPTVSPCPAVDIPNTATEIGTAGFNLAACVVPTYVSSMVVDPNGGTLANSGYFIVEDVSTGRVTISVGASGSAELGETISVTR